MKPICVNCRFWAPHDFAESVGFCQAEPPTVLESMREEGAGFFGIWPLTADDDQCGRFRKKERFAGDPGRLPGYPGEE